MKRHKWIGIGCLTVMFSMAIGLAWAAPQDQQTPSKDEANAFQSAHTERDAQSKINSLDDSVSKYPTSVLLPYVYQDYYLAYFQLKNYPQTIEYVDRLLALNDKLGDGTRIQALAFRAKAYCVGSGNTGLQAPEADTKARDDAAQGLQMLARWLKPQNYDGRTVCRSTQEFRGFLSFGRRNCRRSSEGKQVIGGPVPF